MTAHHRQCGVALIEILVALVVFVFATLGLTGSTINAKRTADGSRHAAEAATLAFDKLEQIRRELPTYADLTIGSHTDSPNPMTVTGGGGMFTRTWTVTTSLPSLTPFVTNGAIARIDMRVSWPSQTGTSAVVLVSYYKLL